jgi:hypothetical protein
MAVTAKMYSNAPKNFLGGASIDLDSDTLKVMLCTSLYTPNQNTHAFKSDVTNEVTGTGYTAGGATLGSVTLATSGTVTTLDAADTSWATSTITARYAVIYDSTPASDATRPLLAYVDFGADVVSSGGTFQITWDATGIATFTAA